MPAPIVCNFKKPSQAELQKIVRDGLVEILTFKARTLVREYIEQTPDFTGRALLLLEPAANYLHIPLNVDFHDHRWNLHYKEDPRAHQVNRDPIVIDGDKLRFEFFPDELDYVEWNETENTGGMYDGMGFVSRRDKAVYNSYHIISGLHKPTPWHRDEDAAKKVGVIEPLVGEMNQIILKRIMDAFGIETK